MSEPALREEGGVAVVKLYETDRERERVGSIEAAVEAVADAQPGDAVCEKIVARDGSVVYSSDRHGPIENWAAEWRLERKRLSESEDVHVCPHETSGCTPDDLCLQCTMDRQIERHSVDGR